MGSNYLQIVRMVLVSVAIQLSRPQTDLDKIDVLRTVHEEQIASFDKDVVERLIKEWAPIVWLAPEETFLPLGVDEFLKNVHTVFKQNNSLTKQMPLGDHSEEAYLVTNADIEELLKDNNSFLYGKNPNHQSVPIYAIVRLCNTIGKPSGFTTKTPLQLSPSTQRRSPYIPVSMNDSDNALNTIRRSSRVNQIFIRTRRHEPLYYNQNETNQTSIETQPSSTSIEPSDLNPQQKSIQEKQVSNFIANLADNVKFSNEIEGNKNINEEMQSHHDPKTNVPAFHVTYWMFYPYSQGKSMCTLSLGPLGSIPFPAVYGYCLGNRKDIGSHVGDWEHMSLHFDGTSSYPKSMYVSAHDAGAYYSYNHLTGSFEFKKQETRKGILQRPNFPKTVTTFTNHPVLFAAKGSHGLWTAPGKHRFVKVARLYDVNGFGTPWHTWNAVEVSYENWRTARSIVPTWLHFKGKWGNPKSKCHPLKRIGLNFCEYTDGPTGIPLKEHHFQCEASNILQM